jgi:hypothetical protein
MMVSLVAVICLLLAVFGIVISGYQQMEPNVAQQNMFFTLLTLFVGLGMLVASFYLKGEMTTSAPAHARAVYYCPSCGHPLRYVQQFEKWYCDYECKYL